MLVVFYLYDLFLHWKRPKQIRMVAIILARMRRAMSAFLPLLFEALESSGLPSRKPQDGPVHLIKFPGRARTLSAMPSLSLSTSKMPTNEVKKALPRTNEFSECLKSAI